MAGKIVLNLKSTYFVHELPLHDLGPKGVISRFSNIA